MLSKLADFSVHVVLVVVVLSAIRLFIELTLHF